MAARANGCIRLLLRFTTMDGFFLSIFLAVCIAAAIVIRFVCYRLSCMRRRLPQDDQIIISSGATPVIVPSQSSRQQQQQQQQQGPQLSLGITDSPLLSRHGDVFTIYTFAVPSTPELERPSRTPPPPKYSTISDSPPKYEDLFPLPEVCNNCKPSIPLPETFSLPSIGLQSPYGPPAFASIAAATIKLGGTSPESPQSTSPNQSNTQSPSLTHNPSLNQSPSPTHSPILTQSPSPTQSESPPHTHNPTPVTDTGSSSTLSSTPSCTHLVSNTEVLSVEEPALDSTLVVPRDNQ